MKLSRTAGNVGAMSIIGVIEDGEALTAILKHPDLWCVKSKPIPHVHTPPSAEYDRDGFSQQPMNSNEKVFPNRLWHIHC
jgi:hypothetical protein